MLPTLGLILFLAFLEGILSIDNAVVLALMARHLPREQQRKALTYGLFGAVLFRLAALAVVTQLLRWTWVKYVGGGYLVFIALKHLFSPPAHQELAKRPVGPPAFWPTVLRIELMDIAFAIDSILAAVALSKSYWVVFTGGFLGVILMRAAAAFFLKLLRRFPKFEVTAYLLVLIIGVKLILETWLDFQSSYSLANLSFWFLMLLAILTGFRKSGGYGSYGP